MNYHKQFGLKKHEQVVTIIYPSAWMYAGWWGLALIAIGVPFFFLFHLLEQSWGRPVFLGAMVLGIFALVKAIYGRSRQKTIITTDRVLVTRSPHLLEEHIVELSFDMIEQITLVKKGLRRLFGIGHVVVVGSEEDKKIILFNIARPAVVKQLLLGLKDKFFAASAKKYQEDAYTTIESLIPELSLEQLKHLRKMIHGKVKGLEGK